jgi:hypothetical protein
VETGTTADLVRHRQTKGAATDRVDLKPPASHSDSTELPTSSETRAFTDLTYSLNHLIRARAAVAGYADSEAADFPVKLAPGYTGAD